MKTNNNDTNKKQTYISVSTFLPIFPGFYNTLYDLQEIDDDTLHNNPADVDQAVKDLIQDNVWDSYDNEAYQNDTAKNACSCLEAVLLDILPDVVKSIKFETVQSPKYYNFSNDSIDCKIDVDFNALLKAFIKAERSGEFLKERYTSYDGFLSSYPNKMADWIADAYEDQSHTVGAMLEFFLLDYSEDISTELYEGVTEDVYAGNYINYGALLKIVNSTFEYNDDLTDWEDLEGFIPEKGGTFSLQLLTGIGLFEIDPEDTKESDYYDAVGLLKTIG